MPNTPRTPPIKVLLNIRPYKEYSKVKGRPLNADAWGARLMSRLTTTQAP